MSRCRNVSSARREPRATSLGSSRRRSSASCSCAPNTARMIALSVMRENGSSVRNGRSCGHVAISRSASSAMIAS